MTDHPGGIRWPLLLVGGVCLVGVGVAVGYRLRPDAPAPTMASPAELVAPHGHSAQNLGSQTTPSALPDAVVTLTPELIARAGIKTAVA